MLYRVSGFRRSLHETADVSLAASPVGILGFLGPGLARVARIFHTGYRLRT